MGQCDLQKLEETKATVASMRQLLETKHARLAATLDGNYPQLKHSVWQSEASQQSAVQTLVPQMTENKAKVGRSAQEQLPSILVNSLLLLQPVVTDVVKHSTPIRCFTGDM